VNAADDLAVLGRVTVSLVVVLALAVLAARLARRAGAKGGSAGLRVVERTGLTRETSVAVVEVGGRGLVVGVTPAGITLLTELTADELAAAAAVHETAVPPEPAAGGDAPAAVHLPRRPSVRRPSSPQQKQGTGAVLDPRTWKQAVEALRDLTARRP
jgi:flagellar protein FliO/FliZ